MISPRTLMAALLALSAATASAQDVLKYRRDILRPGRGEAVTLVPLDAPIYAATRDGLPDIRIQDDQGREVPFAVQVGARTRDVTTTTRVSLDVMKFEVDHSDRVTRIEVDAGRLPLIRLAFVTSSRNFHRQVRIQRPTDGGWVDVGRGEVSLYQLDGLRRESLDMEIAETRAERLRLVIEDGDSPPLEVVGVDGEAVDRRLAFVASAGRSYRLEYGSDTLPAPRYDAESVLAALGDAHRETAGLSPPTPNPGYRQAPDPVAVEPAAWLFLGFFLMTVVLAWAVFRAMRRADKQAMDDFE